MPTNFTESVLRSQLSAKRLIKEKAGDNYRPQLVLGSPLPNERVGRSFEENQARRLGCSNPWQADTLGSCAEEDRRCTKGSMGAGEGWKEDGLETTINR